MLRTAATATLACMCVSVTAAEQRRTGASVCLTVVEKDSLEGPALTRMREEASRIWAHQRVTLIWTADAHCDEVTTLVLDDARLRTLGREQRNVTLARTVFRGRDRTIVVSVQRAFAMLTTLRAKMDISSAAVRNQLGGTLLGRVVAHEVGHVMLGALSHSESGLMRTTLTVEDILSNDDRLIELTMSDKSRLATRFSLSPFDAPIILTQVGLH